MEAPKADAVVWVENSKVGLHYRNMVGKRPVSYFKTWANRRTLESDDDRGASCTVRLNIEKAVEIGRLFWLKHFICWRSNFILDAMFNFEPVKRFKNRRYMSEFGSFRDSRQLELRNFELETNELRLSKVKKEGVAVIKFGVNERGCASANSGKVECFLSYEDRE